MMTPLVLDPIRIFPSDPDGSTYDPKQLGFVYKGLECSNVAVRNICMKMVGSSLGPSHFWRLSTRMYLYSQSQEL